MRETSQPSKERIQIGNLVKEYFITPSHLLQANHTVSVAKGPGRVSKLDNQWFLRLAYDLGANSRAVMSPVCLMSLRVDRPINSFVSMQRKNVVVSDDEDGDLGEEDLIPDDEMVIEDEEDMEDEEGESEDASMTARRSRRERKVSTRYRDYDSGGEEDEMEDEMEEEEEEVERDDELEGEEESTAGTNLRMCLRIVV